MLVFVYPDDNRLIHVFLGNNPRREPDYVINLDTNGGTDSYSLELLDEHRGQCYGVKLTWQNSADDIAAALKSLSLNPAIPNADIVSLSTHYYDEMQKDLTSARAQLERAYAKS